MTAARACVPAGGRAVLGERALSCTECCKRYDSRCWHLARHIALHTRSVDRSRELEVLAPRYLDRTDAELAKAWFRAMRTVPSSEQRRDLLIAAVPFALTSDPKGRRDNRRPSVSSGPHRLRGTRVARQVRHVREMPDGPLASVFA